MAEKDVGQGLDDATTDAAGAQCQGMAA